MTEENRPIATRRISFLLIVLMVSALYAGVRMHNSESLVTNDEPFWLGRSANFARAISQWEPEDTYQMVHPGVPVMWAGAVAYWLNAPEYFDHYTENMFAPFFIDERLTPVGIDTLEMLQDTRLVKLGLETILFAVSVSLVLALGSRLLAATAGVLIALDPFVAGFGPLLHLDSFLTISLFAASLAIAWAMKDPSSRHRWLLAGTLAAIAALTRTTGLAIGVPLLIAFIMLWKQQGFRLTLRAAIPWAIGFAATYILAWPVLWVDPVDTARAIIEWTVGAAGGGHEHPLFFNGTIAFGDPGWLYYPVTILWRTTPVVWLGIILCLVFLKSKAVRARIKPFIPVLIMGAIYLVVMSFGAKKFDRYVLPVYPVISLIAAFGFEASFRWIRTTLHKFDRIVPAIGLTAVALLSLIPLSNAGPYTMNYYNEIMRQFERPEHAIQIGWGEGGSDVVAFLESETERLGRPVIVQTYSRPQETIPQVLKYFMIEDAVQTDQIQFNNVGFSTEQDWNETDYYVFNIQHTQRDMVDDYEFFANVEPIHTVQLGGVTIWEIYAPNQLPVPDSLQGV